jgi:hypothetical protein
LAKRRTLVPFGKQIGKKRDILSGLAIDCVVHCLRYMIKQQVEVPAAE